MAGSFRDRVGRFRGRQAPETAEAAETIGPDELAAVEDEAELEDNLVPATPAQLHHQLAAAREQRIAALRAGDIDGVAAADATIRRLEITLEAWQAQADVEYQAQREREYRRRLEAWARLKPQLEGAQRTVARLAFELFEAIDRLNQVTPAVAALGIVSVAPAIDPLYVNGYWLGERVREHVRATGAMQPATAA